LAIGGAVPASAGAGVRFFPVVLIMDVWLQQFWAGLSGDYMDLPDGTQVGQLVGRLLLAAILGAILGYERERQGKSAGVRTHTLVSLAAAFFVLVPQQIGVLPADMTRVIQGLAAGVGFLGAGSIIKQNEQGVIHGLTTAAGIYFTTAVGIAAGLGRELTAILCTVLVLIVLTLFPRIQRSLEKSFGIPPTPAPNDAPPSPPATQPTPPRSKRK
jgi:putative Mg2+ transporter-C (MgtC) family protein